MKPRKEKDENGLGKHKSLDFSSYGFYFYSLLFLGGNVTVLNLKGPGDVMDFFLYER